MASLITHPLAPQILKRRLAEEKPAPDWLIMNGNRVQIKRKKFESFIDSTDVI